MPKRRKRLTIGQFADIYMKTHETSREERHLYSNVCKLFIKKMVEELVDGKLLKLPHMLGVMGIIKMKNTKHKPIDWKNTRKYKKVIRHLNLGTDGYSYRLRWYKIGKFDARLRNGKLYCFVPSIPVKQKIKRKIQENPNSFFNER
jgi:hypothetical protein